MDPPHPFAEAFEAFWKAPSVARLPDLLHEDVLLVQPLARPIRGLPRAQAEFARIFAWIPDLTGAVDRSAARGDAVFLEFRLSGTIGGRRVEWPVVDRFLLEGGGDGRRAIERISCFDPSPLLAALARPRSWPGFARSGLWRGWLGS